MIASRAFPIFFGVAKHKIITIGRTNPTVGNAQTTLQIQEKITSISARTKNVDRRRNQVDFMAACLVPRLKYTAGSSMDPSKFWHNSKINMWICWDTPTEERVLSWQLSIDEIFM